MGALSPRDLELFWRIHVLHQPDRRQPIHNCLQLSQKLGNRLASQLRCSKRNGNYCSNDVNRLTVASKPASESVGNPRTHNPPNHARQLSQKPGQASNSGGGGAVELFAGVGAETLSRSTTRGTLARELLRSHRRVGTRMGLKRTLRAVLEQLGVDQGLGSRDQSPPGSEAQ